MTYPRVRRRVSVVVGIATVLVLVVGTMRLAAAWAAEAAPLTVAPASATQLAAELADERARAEALTAQLDELAARSQDLAVALGQAHDRIASDAAGARHLKDRLATAKARLAKLESQVTRAQQALAAAPRATGPTSGVARTAGGEHDVEGEHGD